MEDNTSRDEIVKLLTEQKKYMKKQLNLMRILSAVLAAAIIVVFLYVGSLAPKVEKIVKQADTASANLETVAQQLTGANIPATVENINKLMETSESALADAADNMNKIDFETLNQAISDLQKVVEPLANLFK